MLSLLDSLQTSAPRFGHLLFKRSMSTEPVSAANSNISNTKIYTRTGDQGTSALLGSNRNRLPKDALIFDLLGTIDELSSIIGMVRSICSFPSVSKDLETIQCCLFEMGACVAAKNRSSRFIFDDSSLILTLEEQIDAMTEELPPLRHFILPGGTSQTASHLHFSRAVCRRCERLFIRWLNDDTEDDESPQQDTVMGMYLNRLSDYLFTLARYITYKEGQKEIIWQKEKTKSKATIETNQ